MSVWEISEKEITTIFKKRKLKVVNFSYRLKRSGNGVIYFITVNR